MGKPTVRFSGESSWDAIVNHYSLDIIEEDTFSIYLTERGYGRDIPLETLEEVYEDWTVDRLE